MNFLNIFNLFFEINRLLPSYRWKKIISIWNFLATKRMYQI
jgi:hypothetical protein